MTLSFGEKIKNARKAKNLTQKQLAIKIGAAHNSISDWENNKNKPDPDTIELLCGVLDMTPNYLLASEADDFSPEEKILIKKYRSLDPNGQEHVNTVLEWETARVTVLSEKEALLVQSESKPHVRIIQYYQRLASAGTGEVIFMEPLYYDGDMLLIEPTCQVDIGEIGIFIVGDKAYVKKLGNGELISLNTGYENIPLTEDSKCMGRVVDKYNL